MANVKNRRFLCKGDKIAAGDKVTRLDPITGDLEFYEVVRVWGSHVVMKVISQAEAGTEARAVALTPDI